jgi:thiol:disulfide interchange protein
MRGLKALTIGVVAVVGSMGYAAAAAAVEVIYPPPEQAASDLAAALQTAAATQRRIIVDFGGNWCPDCHVLDGYFHDPANRSMLEANYILVHVNIGQLDKNVELAARYHIPLRKGVPALAVLDSAGRLLHSQEAGEFEDMRHLQASAVTAFLRAWKVQ